MRAEYAGKLALLVVICSLFSCSCVPAQAVVPDRGLITGYVLDEDGNPVSAANVTLWQDGQFWQRTRVTYAASENPQASDIHNGNEGYFIFGFADLGNYTVKAEKDGYVGTAQLLFGTVTVVQNVTIKGYHVPSFTPGQLAYTGAITGTVYESGGQDMTDGANVSLWQDGQMVKMPGNPQLGVGSHYLFEHLSPGRYDVLAGMQYVRVFRNDTAEVTVDVNDCVVTVDLVLPFAAPRMPPPTPSPTPAPSPSAGIVVVALSLGISVLLVGLFRRTR